MPFERRLTAIGREETGSSASFSLKTAGPASASSWCRTPPRWPPPNVVSAILIPDRGSQGVRVPDADTP